MHIDVFVVVWFDNYLILVYCTTALCIWHLMFGGINLYFRANLEPNGRSVVYIAIKLISFRGIEHLFDGSTIHIMKIHNF